MKTKFQKLGQKGFTLIELIITIVIIGVLAAVAIPKFQDLTNDAERGVAAGVAAALASATSVNYARSKVPGAIASPTAGFTYYPLADCAALNTAAAALADFPAGYSVSGGASALPATGVSTAGCSVTKGSINVPFNAYGS